MTRRNTNTPLIATLALDSSAKQLFRRRMLRWFEQHRRDMPWRKTRDPYRVWVSEIMLQQTQVATVLSYYDRFIKQFPDVNTLAKADEDEVLRLWEGLGYYRRARQMHKAAQIIASELSGVIPTDSDALQALPGIGRYTAGAILSIAHDQREPILEANTIRLIARLIALREPPTATVSQRALWSAAEELLPRKNVGEFNQSLMELGSLVCTPREPACSECPVATHCQTFAAGLQAEIPVAKEKTQYEAVDEVAVVVRKGTSVLLRRCGADERWAGLWDFPRFAIDAKASPSQLSQIAQHVQELTGISPEQLQVITTFKHAVTRYRITLTCYEGIAASGRIKRGGDVKWVRPNELADLPLSVTGRKLAAHIS